MIFVSDHTGTHYRDLVDNLAAIYGVIKTNQAIWPLITDTDKLIRPVCVICIYICLHSLLMGHILSDAIVNKDEQVSKRTITSQDQEM